MPQIAHMNGDAIRRGSTPGVNSFTSSTSRSPAGKLSAVVIDDAGRLRALAPEWASLLERSGTNEITLHPEWMLTWWDVFGGTDKRALRCLAIYDEAQGKRLVGLAPLLARPHTYRPGIPFRRLEMLASGEDEADEICSEYLGIVAERDYEAAVAEELANALTSGVLGGWDELVLPTMNAESPLPKLLEAELAKRGIIVTLEESTAAPYITLPQTFDAYLGQLKQNKRGQLKKSLRALETWAGGMPGVERVKSLDQLEYGKKTLETIHRERWASEGVYRSTRYRQFHDRVMPKLLEMGALDLGWITVREQPVAAFYNLRWNGRVSHYQSGRKVDIPDDVRAGVTMHALLIRDYIEAGMREYDFLAGVVQYKMSLAPGTRPLVTLRAARPSVVESARRAAEEGILRAKKVRDYAKRRFGGASADADPNETPGIEAPPAKAGEPKAPKSRVARALDNRARAVYFGPQANEGRALFGFYHAPRGGPGKPRAVVICPPLGYEGICAYPALRIFAERLAASGHPVLRFDYDGTGDSGGLDSDPGRVRAWIDSVGHAIDEVRALSGADEVCVFGVRMGATLAAAATAERGDVDRLVLWNPCPTGRAYAREMKMFRQFAEQTGELTARPKAEGDTSEESGGFLLTAETLDALKKLDLLKLTKRAADTVLVLGRDDVPDDDKLAKALEAHGALATYQKLGGYAEMMVAPHKSVFPEGVYNAMREWLDETSIAPPRGEQRRTSTARAHGGVAPGVREEAIRFGSGSGYFGILTEPADASLAKGKPLFIFSNTAANYRIGPNRMYVEMARKMAALGLPSFRIDVSGIGDSVIWEDEWPNHPYSEQLIDDIRAVIQHFKSKGRFDRFGVAGLCSGAFVAYHAALADPAIVSVALINLQIFAWEEGMSLEVNPLANRDATEYYKRRFFAKEAWLKLLQGGVDPRHALSAVQGRVVDMARATFAKVKAKIPIDASRGSAIARAFDAMTKRGVDVLIVFAGNDPGIDNLNEKVGTSMQSLLKRSNFKIETIDGPDHSFTPLWAQAELDRVLVGHLTRTFGDSKAVAEKSPHNLP